MDTSLTPKKSDLIQDLRALIEAARGHVARMVNTGQVGLYWSVGERLRRDVLGGKRGAYGRKIVATVSQQLVLEYGKGYSESALGRMVQFVEKFPDFRIPATLSRKLTWSHFVLLIPIKDRVEREFYAEMCRVEGWTVPTLRAKINGMLFERTALSRKPAELALKELEALRHDDVMTPDLVFQDPYCLDFLGLKGAYLEERDSHSSRGRRRSRSGERIFTSISCSITGCYAGWWSLSSSWDASRRSTKGRWNSTCVGSISTSARRGRRGRPG